MAKLAAFREKDLEFVAALLAVELLDPGVLTERIDRTPSLPPPHRRRLLAWVRGATSEPGAAP